MRDFFFLSGTQDRLYSPTFIHNEVIHLLYKSSVFLGDTATCPVCLAGIEIDIYQNGSPGLF